MIYDLQGLNPFCSIVLIGMGKTGKYFKDIVRPESEREMKETFGSCELTDAFSLLFQMGCKDVCVMNIGQQHDYLDIAEMLRDYAFAFVVPLGIHASDAFYDPTHDGRKTPYAQYLLSRSYGRNDSYLIMTDKHASLYQDIDAFLDEMETKRERLKRCNVGVSDHGNLIFVVNNIEGIDYASVCLAGIMASTPVEEYPRFTVQPARKAIFHIDTCDVHSDMVYFKSHIDGSLTVENFLNLRDEKTPLKIEFLHRIQKYMLMDMDFSEHVGHLYSAYRLKAVEHQAMEYLESYMGWLLQSYELNHAYAVENPKFLGTVDIHISAKVKPIDCTEQFEVEKIIGNKKR